MNLKPVILVTVVRYLRRSAIALLFVSLSTMGAPDYLQGQVKGTRVRSTGAEPTTATRQAADANSKPGELLQGMLALPRVARAAVQRIRPSLVTIESFGGVSTFQGKIGGIRTKGEGNTTGVIVSAEGHIVTSLFSFIDQPRKTTVITSDGVRRVATPLGRDETRNLCLLKIGNVDNLPVPEFLRSDDVNVGIFAISVGVGYGDENPAISTGIVSAKHRIGGIAVQTDANTSPANYGGPLIDVQGRVIGICVPLSPKGNGTGAEARAGAGAGVEWYDSGIGFATPLYDSPSLLTKMKQGATIQRGYIGIQLAPPIPDAGATIEQVTTDSPADEAGLRAGDVVLRLNDDNVANGARLRQLLSQHSAGDSVTLTVLRTDSPPHADRSDPAAESESAPEPNRPDSDSMPDDDESNPSSDDAESTVRPPTTNLRQTIEVELTLTAELERGKK